VVDELLVASLGEVPYEDAVAMQQRIRAARQAGTVPDVLLLLEHPPIYTKGRRTAHTDLPMGEEWYRTQGVEVYESDRGGSVTYHGPGQLVGYPIMRVHDVALTGRRISTLTLGEGPDVVLLHGLGSAKTSFFDTAAALRREGYRVHAIDLPGFGSSTGRATAPYSAGWFADTVVDWMDALGIDRAHVVGNSLGGRVALEVGLRAPERVGALVVLCPAVAFVKRGLEHVVRALRPELGMLPHRIARPVVARQLSAMFADADALDPSVKDIAIDEFQHTYSSAGARLAFLRAARNIYLDEPFGDDGFYPRLATLEPDALFVWGTHDPLIPASFGRHVHQWLPSAEQVVLEGCGHVPQIEQPEATTALILGHLRRGDARSPGAAVGLAA